MKRKQREGSPVFLRKDLWAGALPLLQEPKSTLLSNQDVEYPSVQNLVFTVDFRTRVDLRKLTDAYYNTCLNRSAFASARMWKTSPSNAGLLAESGKLVCVGTKSADAAVVACHRYRKDVAAVGYKPGFANPRVQNMVASGKFHHRLSLAKMHAENNEDTIWEPDSFPGLFYTLKGMRGLLFDSGKYIITGFCEYGRMLEEYLKLLPIARAYVDNNKPSSSKDMYKYRKEQKKIYADAMSRVQESPSQDGFMSDFDSAFDGFLALDADRAADPP